MAALILGLKPFLSRGHGRHGRSAADAATAGESVPVDFDRYTAALHEIAIAAP